jgi:tetratricopeptide (TPR) repeat protein
MDAGSPKPTQGQRISLTWGRIRTASSPARPPGEWEAKGDGLVQSGKVAEALDCYTKGITEDQDNLDLWMKKADAFLALKRYRSALFCTDSALTKDSSRPDIWLMRGLLLHTAGDNEGAVEAANYSLSLKGDVLEGWALKAESLMELNRFEEARSCLQFAEDIKAQGPEVQLLGPELERRIGEDKRCPMCGAQVEAGGIGCQKCELDVLIEDSQICILKVKNSGKGVTEAEELLSTARSLREKGFQSQALKAIRPMSDLLGKDWQAGAWALQIVDETEDVSEALETDQLVGTVSLREKTEKVRDAIKAGQMVKAVVLARSTLDLAKKIAQKYSLLLLKDPERRKAKKAARGPTCPSCGETVDPEWVKCPVCKSMLKEEPKAALPPPKPAQVPVASPGELEVSDGGVLFCPTCKEEVEDFWVKCLFCGAKLMGPKGGG